MKPYLRWAIIIFVLIVFLLLRLAFKSTLKTKKLFDKKQIVELNFKHHLNEEISIKKDTEQWLVIKVSSITGKKSSYLGDKEQIELLIDNIKKFELLEKVTKNKDAYKNYNLDDEQCTKLKISIKKGKDKTKDEIVYLGKSGGFSYEESYVRVQNRPEVFLAKGVNVEMLKRPFYEFCNKSILKCDTEKISSINIRYKTKNLDIEKIQKEGSITWINKKTKKSFDTQKVSNYLTLFKEFNADSIIDTDYPTINPDYEVTLLFEDKGELKLSFYEKKGTSYGEYCLVKIKKLLLSNNVSFIGNEEVFYGIFEFRYKDFEEQPEKF